ncbi:serine/threonine-protein kinase pakD-like [Clytia hemisphaerica]|uniref:serine/threonine-protein kinase pakD-like n=1 Tax=Clytia hemisphaerica TaxID=252671 RepID=UPI0034D508A7
MTRQTQGHEKVQHNLIPSMTKSPEKTNNTILQPIRRTSPRKKAHNSLQTLSFLSLTKGPEKAQHNLIPSMTKSPEKTNFTTLQPIQRTSPRKKAHNSLPRPSINLNNFEQQPWQQQTQKQVTNSTPTSNNFLGINPLGFLESSTSSTGSPGFVNELNNNYGYWNNSNNNTPSNSVTNNQRMYNSQSLTSLCEIVNGLQARVKALEDENSNLKTVVHMLMEKSQNDNRPNNPDQEVDGHYGQLSKEQIKKVKEISKTCVNYKGGINRMMDVVFTEQEMISCTPCGQASQKNKEARGALPSDGMNIIYKYIRKRFPDEFPDGENNSKMHSQMTNHLKVVVRAFNSRMRPSKN